MNDNQHTSYIKTLIDRYDLGKTSLEEEEKLFAYFAQDDIAPELSLYAAEFKAFPKDLKSLGVSDSFVENTFSLLSDQPPKLKTDAKMISMNRYLMLAASVVLLALAFGLGYFSRGTQEIMAQHESADIQSLKNEVSSMKELMVQNFLDQKQNHQKLYALTMASQLDSINEEILDKVFTTLNHDRNVNIRLAAADMLYQFASDKSVQEGLVDVFPNQESPLVILELVRLIKSLDETTSQKLLDKIINQKNLKDSQKIQIVNTYKSI